MNDSNMTNRRDFLRNSVGLTAAATVSATTLSGCSNIKKDNNSAAIIPGKPKPWVNWAGNEFCYPQSIKSPTTEDEISEVLKQTKGQVRAVGAGHSFSPVVPTNDTLISTDLLSGLISHDDKSKQATLWAGTRIHDAGPILEEIGQAFSNLPDMDYPSLAGAVVNSVHGTGTSFGSMSSYVTGLNLITPQGELLECNRNNNSDIFQAARTSVGSLGVISQLTFSNVESFNLTEVMEMADVYETLDNIDQLFEENRNFELFAFPLTSRCATVTTNIAKPEDKNYGEEDPGLLNDLQLLYKTVGNLPLVGQPMYQGIVSGFEPSNGKVTCRTGASYKVLAHQRLTRFREMEYTVPVEAGPDCLREILATIKNKKLPMNFPIEYRHVKQDDIWLSMFEGQTGASISVHQFADWDYKSVFAHIEPIFWKYAGRPHWGKIHTLGYKQLADLYPKHWQDFSEIRQQLDPQGKMLNDHLKQVFIV